MSVRRNLERELESGAFDSLLRLTSDEAFRAEALDLTILAHALAGELEGVLWHCSWIEQRGLRLGDEERATIYFALGVAYTRISEYTKARREFARSFALRRTGFRSCFFLHQGLGFFRFFCGNFTKAADHAQRAYDCATQSRFELGRLLAEELLAHALIESGQVRRGIKHLRTALQRAKELQHQSLQKTIRLLLLLSEARFGLSRDSIGKLERALHRLHPQDSYSRNAVKLELANQWGLRGRPKKAMQVLDEARDSIYSSRNRRHIALLNFRFAFFTWIRGHREEALRLLKSTELHLHPEVDVTMQRRIAGLERRLTGDSQQGATPPLFPGEDPLGDLYARIQRKNPDALTEILERRLFYFLFRYFNLEFKQRALFFDLLPKGVVVVDRGEIHVLEKGLTRVLRRLLELLSQAHCTKEELVSQVWGYSYDPIRHDPLIYTSISKLRQLLGRSWIEADEKGYRLTSGVQLQMQKAPEREKREEVLDPLLGKQKSLSYRQLRILSAFGKRRTESLGVEDVMREFAVSRATATRDLASLTEEGLLLRLGRARATRYIRGER